MNDLEIFKSYVNKFDMSDKNIARKYWHSIRVMNNAVEIAHFLKLDEHNLKLAQFIGLTHDIGRFLQWKIYGTFVDNKSIDHAILGIQVLFGESKQVKFNITPGDEKVIRSAIYNHNKYKIDELLSEDELLHAKIIRDADKIDLLYLLGEEEIILEEDNSEVTDVIADAFWNFKEIDTLDCKTLSDKILFKMAFVFDINFLKSFEIMKKEKLLDKFYNNLKYKEKYKTYYLHAKEFLDSKVSI